MKTITLEELRKVKVGDKVKIVDKAPTQPRCRWNVYMDAFLGKVCTVKYIDMDTYNFPVLHLVEDDGQYSWTEGMIEKVIPQEHYASDAFFKLMGDMLKGVLKAREQFSFVKAIEKVIYNEPATIIIWADGTKTTAKCAEGETYDPEKGLVICALKKFVSAESIMNLLQFTREGNGTVTYKDVLSKNRVDKKKKVKTFTIDCIGKSNIRFKAETKAKKKDEIDSGNDCSIAGAAITELSSEIDSSVRVAVLEDIKSKLDLLVKGEKINQEKLSK